MTANFTGGSGGGSGGYNYVQNAQPADAVEGEEWYDTGANAAYVYDGASWIELTVVDHSQLSGVGAADHHAKPTGTQAASQVAGYISQDGSLTLTGDYYNVYGGAVEMTDQDTTTLLEVDVDYGKSQVVNIDLNFNTNRYIDGFRHYVTREDNYISFDTLKIEYADGTTENLTASTAWGSWEEFTISPAKKVSAIVWTFKNTHSSYLRDVFFREVELHQVSVGEHSHNI